MAVRAFVRRAHSSVNSSEISQFASQAEQWWDLKGPASMLHRMNPVRVAFVRSALEELSKEGNFRRPLKNLRILDVGCGVGILSEPLARLGAEVHGCDASEASIEVAKSHQPDDLPNLRYSTATVEQLSARKTQNFDCVILSEVIEHVNEPANFLANCASLVSSDGRLVLSTINRTVSSFLATKVVAEHMVRLLPVGTHDWRKYAKPEEVAGQLSLLNMNVDEVAGIEFNPLTRRFQLSSNLSVNYILSASKETPADT
ncbi:hypothetical protein NDN08_006190 [Rhodosorus marinus]|uniref:Ubiquinone biosynthesis O-methyltransferase, mitochondrial n=1 Tax=Rhodosorus marinus TaxID=101924 RepID=A0AAV8UJZ4_9RHOD|nr:hypothetical protein NDN08_006190 [Rhodosorus marinus]